MKYMSVFLLILTGTVYSQDFQLPMEDGKVVFRQVTNVSSASIDELSERSDFYFEDHSDCQLTKKDSTTYFGVAQDDFFAGKDNLKIKMSYNITIELKDGRYRTTCYKIEYTPYPDKFNPQPQTFSVEDVHSKYQINMSKSGKRKEAQHQLGFLQNTERLINERITEIEETLIRSVPLKSDNW